MKTPSFIKPFIFYLLIVFLFPFRTYSTHIIGGELYYQCIGSNNYIITLKLYRDGCQNCYPFDHPTSIYIFNPNGTLFNEIEFNNFDSLKVPLPLFDLCYSNEPITVWEITLETTVNLPAATGGYTIVYQRCCRTGDIINIANSNDFGTTYFTHIPDPASLCNSSPLYNNYPPVFLCVDDTFLFDHSATDLDGDSLVYELCPSFDGADVFDPKPDPPLPPPYNYIQYQAPYSAYYPMDANPPLTIDSETGLLTGKPVTIGKYNVTVCVSEFRNGNFMGSASRDFIFNVVNCIEKNITAGFFHTDSALMVNFSNTSIIQGNAAYSWDFGDGSFSSDSNPSHLFNTSGIYNVCLTVSDTGCYDIFCDTIAVTGVGVETKKGFNMQINFYPNPLHSTTIFKITARMDKKPLTFELFTLAGENVMALPEITGNRFEVERGNLSGGGYFYKISDRDGLLRVGKIAVE
ncbi:MAG: PKD domain-containing protein [Bacteroidetes bacterium]|nr:PKD domain-containing protein [Bacteroidota bacterium]